MVTNETHMRVLPRDLFNEAKLLKCLGRLALLIEDGMIDNLRVEHPGREGFQIEQDESSGDLECVNLAFIAGKETRVRVSSSYNSKDAFPLYFETDDDCGRVFDEDGSFSAEFIEHVASVR